MLQVKVEAELVKLSICKCGFPLLHGHIKLGTKYFVNPSLIHTGAKMQCGGCGKVINFGPSIYTYNRSGPGGHFLPTRIFKITPDAKSKEAAFTKWRTSRHKPT